MFILEYSYLTSINILYLNNYNSLPYFGTMAESLAKFDKIEKINAKESSSKIEEYLCYSLDSSAKVMDEVKNNI